MNSTSIETATLEAEVSPSKIFPEKIGRAGTDRNKVSITNILLALALTASVGTWFTAIRSPLWLDETFSYWQISGGFWQIWNRQPLSFPAYSYILWFATSLLGSSEVGLRIPSALAMMAAVYLLFRIAREFFEFDVAIIVAVVFCLHPIAAFAAIDARPYAFGALMVNCAILILLRWMKTNSTRDAILFGMAAASVFYFHYLFGTILAAFALLIAAAKAKEWRAFAPKLAIASVAFVLMVLPVVRGFINTAQTSKQYVFAGAPAAIEFFFTLAPGIISLVFVGAAFVAALVRKFKSPENQAPETALSCLLLAAAPLTILYCVSTLTPVQVFVARYRMVALPGVALCWGLLVSSINSKMIRAGFCIGLVVITLSGLSLTLSNPHEYTWKYALAAADANAAPDRAPLLICSDFPESNYRPMPAEASTSSLFTQLSYYKVKSPVVPLPRALTDQTVSQVNTFLNTAAPARQRFLVVAFGPSTPTIKWIMEATKGLYQAREIGVYSGVAVVEFTPSTSPQ